MSDAAPPVRDGCEWCPSRGEPATAHDGHHRTTPAAVMVGAKVDWRLCASCAALPRFRRYRVLRPIAPASDTGDPR